MREESLESFKHRSTAFLPKGPPGGTKLDMSVNTGLKDRGQSSSMFLHTQNAWHRACCGLSLRVEEPGMALVTPPVL